jgi:ABC-type uncharacterized transport system permease subunit
MSLVVASFLLGGWFSWALPIAVAAAVWTFVFLTLGRRRDGE